MTCGFYIFLKVNHQFVVSSKADMTLVKLEITFRTVIRTKWSQQWVSPPASGSSERVSALEAFCSNSAHLKRGYQDARHFSV